MTTRSKPYNILVCEDENFQRLALLDILTMCEYDTVPAENGVQAMDHLNNEQNDFDLVLLDLNMPEMDGFEVLTLMQQDERLSKIPVVVMSANESNDIIANCLKLGAKNYLVKPIRITQCRALVAFMKIDKTPVKPETLQGLDRYEKISYLGKGAAGMVDLVRNKITNEEVALKQMNLTFLSDKEKQSAETEVELMKVITGPTIIKFYEAFRQNQDIYIVMEYAEGGSLAQLIQKHASKKMPFQEDDILMYTAQITLSLMALHSKQILHRDIKSLNIFIKKGVLKLGDFGISKALGGNDLASTIVGTPYFMAPEVCKGEQYGAKADVWAMGVIIYELCTLKKPFDGNNITAVFDQIINKPIDALPNWASSDLQNMIKSLLNKEKDKRPSIFDVTTIPCIRKKILDFINEYDCKEEVMQFFDVEQLEKEDKHTNVLDVVEERKAKADPQSASLEELEDYAEEIRQEVPIKDHAAGWLGKHLRCVQGKDIYDWLMEHFEQDKKKAAQMCQKMLEKKLISAVEEGKGKIFNVNNLFRFRQDRDDIADNMIKTWNGEPGDPVEVSKNLVNLATDVYQQAIVEDEEDEEETRDEEEEDDDVNMIDVEAALKSAEYKKYIAAAGELEKLDILNLSEEQKVAVFLNVYQSMYVHYFLKKVYEEGDGQEEGEGGGSGGGFMGKLSSMIFAYSPKPFFYNIGGFNFNLEEIKHGLLRDNVKSPNNYMASLKASDSRLEILSGFRDPRINLVCLDYPQFLEHIDPFEGETEEKLDECLEQFVTEIINAKVVVSMEEGQITIPQVFQTYKADFGGNVDGILSFIFRYLEEEDIDFEQVSEAVRDKSLVIKYE